MLKCKLYRSPLLVAALTVQLLSSHVTSVKAASVNLDNTEEKSECQRLKRSNSESSEQSGLLPEKDSQISSLSNNLSNGNSDNLIAQVPDSDNSKPSESGCPVAGEGACEISGGDGCEVGGDVPQGGGVLPAVAAAGGGFPIGALAAIPAGIIPFVGGGGGGDDDDGGGNTPEQIPEPSTLIGSAIALGIVTKLRNKRKISRRNKLEK
jgi:hypothetical protein